MNNFWILFCIVGIITISSFGQQDIAEEDTYFCRSLQRRNVQVDAQQGRPGKLGPIGPIGQPGPKGDRGLVGDKGDRGLVGAKGDRGFVGAKGDRGLVGVKGDRGLVGVKGDRGLVGAKGDRGLVGAKGDRGFVGIKGDRGLAGAKGDRGFVGAKGDRGLVGAKGDRGFVGAKGDRGLVGAKGNRGIAGVCSCSPSEIEQLNQTLQSLTEMIRRRIFQPHDYVDNCSVGLKDGRVNDDDITASSVYHNDHAARNGRLDFQGQRSNPFRHAGWRALNKRAGEWIQVDLRRPNYVTGVITQGRARHDEWITSYKIAYANNTNSFRTIQDGNGNDVVFQGNRDRSTYAMNRFRQPITARYFRLIAESWNGEYISARLEYINC